MVMLPEKQVIGVAVLNRLARELLETHLLGLWVSGEVSNLSRAASGHYYFALKDGTAQVRCALFKGRMSGVDLSLKEGDQIELTGKITLYEARGEFQIVVEQIRQTGAGKLYAAYEALKEKLSKEGIFATEKKQTIPFFPKTIGIITSPSAAALRDVVMTIRRRMGGNVHLILYPTAVQGKGSELSIANAIAIANQRNEADVLLLCRGGGSIEDLWSFNEEIVVRAIAAAHLPIISGIGHETDFTLSDFVADVRASTPTAAAELAVPDKQQLLGQVLGYSAQIRQQMERRCTDANQSVDRLNALLRQPRQLLKERKNHIFILLQQLHQQMDRKYEQNQHRLAGYQTQLTQHRPNLAFFRQRIAQLEQQMTQYQDYTLRDKRQKLASITAILTATSPKHILARGFSVVRNSKGHIIRSPHGLRLGQKIHIDFAEGSTQAVVSEEGAQKDLFD